MARAEKGEEIKKKKKKQRVRKRILGCKVKDKATWSMYAFAALIFHSCS